MKLIRYLVIYLIISLMAGKHVTVFVSSVNIKGGSINTVSSNTFDIVSYDIECVTRD